MIIWGTNTVLRRTEFIVDACPNCGHINSVEINIFQKYFHLFYIPTIPPDKSGWSKCDNCEEVLSTSQMRGAFLSAYVQILKSTGYPLWMFSGTGIAVFAIVWATFASAQQH